MLRQGTSPQDEMARDCIVARLRILTREVTNIYDKALRPLGIKISQANLLTAVAKLGPVSPTRIGKLLHIEKSTMSRNIERMRARGWLRVVPGEDERSNLVSVTAKGRRLLEKMLPAWQQAQEETESLLEQRAITAIHRAVERMWQAEFTDS